MDGETEKGTSVTEISISNPLVTFDLTDHLSHTLQALGFTPLCCSLVVVQQLVAMGFLHCRALLGYVSLRVLMLCEELCFDNTVESWTSLQDVGMTVDVATT